MRAIRTVLVAAGLILVCRPALAQAATLSEDALRAYALRQIAIEQKAKVEPMPLPSLDLFPPDPPPDPPKPKADPAPPPVMIAMRATPRVERGFCSRFGMHKVQLDRWRWRCRR